MKLKVGRMYITRNFRTVEIVEEVGGYFMDNQGRFYSIDGVPTSGGVGDGFRIIGEHDE